MNPKLKHPGTLGLIATQGASRYILSCYHVLCRLDRAAFQKGEEIYLIEDTGRVTPIATVDRGLPDVDVAAAVLPDGIEALGGIAGFPQLQAPAEAEEGMIVVKVGQATGRTEGRINRIVDDDVWIEPVDESAIEPISSGGDSGSVWVVRNTWAPVVLHTGTNDTGTVAFARGRILTRALDLLSLQVLPG